MVCKPLKILYDLKQASKLWYKQLSQFLLKKLGLKKINIDHSIFVIIARINKPIVNTFVDDIKVIRVKRSGYIKKVKRELALTFEMIDIGPISFYLGLKVERNQAKKTLKLLQPAYIDKILTKYHINQAKPCNTSLKKRMLLPNKSSKVMQAKREQYQGMIGSFMFSMV